MIKKMLSILLSFLKNTNFKGNNHCISLVKNIHIIISIDKNKNFKNNF